MDQPVAAAAVGVGLGECGLGSGGAFSRPPAPPAADLAPERGHLDRLGAEADVRQAEAAADDPAVPEEPLHLVRVGRACRCRSPSAAGRAAGRARCRRPGRRRSRSGAAGRAPSARRGRSAARNRVLRARHDDRITHRSQIVGRFGSRIGPCLGDGPGGATIQGCAWLDCSRRCRPRGPRVGRDGGGAGRARQGACALQRRGLRRGHRRRRRRSRQRAAMGGCRGAGHRPRAPRALPPAAPIPQIWRAPARRCRAVRAERADTARPGSTWSSASASRSTWVRLFGAAAELFDTALGRSVLIGDRDRLLLLDWWATALDREAQTRPVDGRPRHLRADHRRAWKTSCASDAGQPGRQLLAGRRGARRRRRRSRVGRGDRGVGPCRPQAGLLGEAARRPRSPRHARARPRTRPRASGPRAAGRHRDPARRVGARQGAVAVGRTVCVRVVLRPSMS